MKVHRLRENRLLSKIFVWAKVGMIGRTELEKLPRCWGGRNSEEDVGNSLGGCQIG